MAKGIYSPDEVVTSYRQAKDKKAQIRILAELQGCSVKEIEDLLRERGALEAPEASLDERIAALHAEGLSQREIASRVGVDRNTVRAHGKAMGLVWEAKSGSGHALTGEEIASIREKAAAGLSASAIAHDIGRTVSAVRANAKKLGIAIAPAYNGADRGGRFAGFREWIADGELEGAPEDKPDNKPEDKPVRSKPLFFDDLWSVLQIMSALFGGRPERVEIEGEILNAVYPNGMFQLHACRFETEGETK